MNEIDSLETGLQLQRLRLIKHGFKIKIKRTPFLIPETELLKNALTVSQLLIPDEDLLKNGANHPAP